jgi:hypothetical protein
MKKDEEAEYELGAITCPSFIRNWRLRRSSSSLSFSSSDTAKFAKAAMAMLRRK